MCSPFACTCERSCSLAGGRNVSGADCALVTKAAARNIVNPVRTGTHRRMVYLPQTTDVSEGRISLYHFFTCFDLLATATAAKATFQAIRSRRTVRPGLARAPERTVPGIRGATTFPLSASWQGP